MADPVAWLVIETGWEVVGSDGERLGEVQEVIGDTNADIFDGLSVSTGLLKKPKYVPSERVGEIVEGRVTLDLAKDDFERLDEYDEPPPSERFLSALAERIRASSRASAVASRAFFAITRHVSSPASVPTISSCSTRSSARAIAGAEPSSEWTTTMFCAARALRPNSARTRASASAGSVRRASGRT